MVDHLRHAVHLLTGAAMPNLAHRVRWLFLALLLMVLGIAALSLPADSSPAWPDGLAALAGLAAWAAWAWYRYRHPAAPWWTDAVPVAAMLVVGASTATASSVFGPSFVTLYFRSMYGTLRQAVANASLLAGGFLAVLVLQEGPGAALTTGGVLLVIAYVAVGVVMQALGHAARQHEITIGYERTLADVSRQLLAARTPEAVHRVAVDGAVALVDHMSANASLWLGTEEAVLRAEAGPTLLGVERGRFDQMPPELLQRLAAGEPVVLRGDRARQLETTYGQAPRFGAMLIAPILRDGQMAGGLVLAGEQSVDDDLLDVLGRFTNEITLAIERAELTVELQEANARLREADEMKNRFLSMVSHELRTPLTTIRGFTQTLRTQGQRLTDEERDHFLEIIDRQGGHQQRMVEELLMTSRIVAGRTPVTAEPVAWREVIDATLEELQVAPAHVRVDCPATAVVHADPAHLRQVLTNLVTNAQKYGAPPLVVEVVEGEAVHTLRVRDHGPGVDPGFREYLFDPFRQAETLPDRPVSSGVGLGLAIVEGLVRANGGTIEHVPADPGSIFEVRLPASIAIDVPPDRMAAHPG